MAIRIGSVKASTGGFGLFQLVETEYVEDADSVEEYVAAALENNPGVRRNERLEAEVDGLIINQNGGVVIAFEWEEGQTSIACVFEYVEED